MQTTEQKIKKEILILVLISTALFVGYVCWAVVQTAEMIKLVQ